MADLDRNSLRCLGYVGFAGDRTPEAMACVAEFAEVLAGFLDIPLDCMGQPGDTHDLPWDAALKLSVPFFDRVKQQYSELLSASVRPILVTSRCATAIATLPVVNHYHPDVVVLWLDAHGDLNTPATSPSGYLGGMPLAAGLGLWDSGYGAGLSGDRAIHLGGRDWDEGELAAIEEKTIAIFTTTEIQTDLQPLVRLIDGRDVYVHLDTDVYEPSEVVAEYAVADGLTRGDVAAILSEVMRVSNFVGLEITELSPKIKAQKISSYQALLDSFAPLKIQ